MDANTRNFVRRRASNRCGYCPIPQAATAFFSFHVEHIVARQHQGDDDLENLCLACNRCNAHKGPNLSSIDPKTNEMVPLFHPRKSEWQDHCTLNGGEIRGITPTGRATVRLLNMNVLRRVELRQQWLRESGSFRPDQ